MAKIKKLTSMDYRKAVDRMKASAQADGLEYVDINAQNLLDKTEPGVRNLPCACRGMMAAMLDGDKYLEQPGGFAKVGSNLTIRYFCKVLSEGRKGYIELLKEAKLAESQIRYEREMKALDEQEALERRI